MRQEILSVSKAKSKLLSLVRAMEEEGRSYILTKDGEPVGAMVPMIDYESFLETDEISKNEGIMRDLRAALNDEKKGRIWKRNKQGHWIKAKN